MQLRTLDDAGDLRGKRVLLRADLNVPIESGAVADSARGKIRASLPTLRRLRSAGARTIVVSHLGEPKEGGSALSLAPVAAALSEEFGSVIQFVPEAVGGGDMGALRVAVDAMQDGDVIMLENVRLARGETGNDPSLAGQLASLADAYVNDAFAASHREHASIVGVPALLPAYAGELVALEVAALSRLLEAPERPYVAVLGGAKVSSKLATLARLVETADRVLVGGGMANAFFAAQGLPMGRSRPPEEEVSAAQRILASWGEKIALPVDVVASSENVAGSASRVCLPGEVGEREYALDAGPASLAAFADELAAARAVVWNGPLGVFEKPPFDQGTMALASAAALAADRGAFVVCGGGETLLAIARAGVGQRISHCSTGGGAMLEFLAEGDLPGLAALRRA